jgi:hypothetical protein
LSEWTSSDWVHGTWFKIHQYCSWYISSSSGFVIIYVDSFELKIRISVICTGGVDSVFIRHDFPEFGTNLITTLTSLYVNDFSHFIWILNLLIS